MDTASLYQGLTFLAWTGVVFLIVVGLFLIKVLFDLSRLLKIINETTQIVQDSVKPICADLSEAVNIVNKMIKRTESNVDIIRNLSGRAVKIVFAALSKTSSISKIVFSGLWSILKTFMKK